MAKYYSLASIISSFLVNLVTTGTIVDTVSKGYFTVGMTVTVVSGILLLINFISVTVAVLVTRHCYKDSDKSPNSSLLKSALPRILYCRRLIYIMVLAGHVRHA